MIAYFPSVYPDELLYSLLSRYAAQSGYLTYTAAAQELFVRKTAKPNIEFITPLKGDVLQHATKNLSLRAFLERHTMFPYYARFLPKERRRQALDLLCQMDERYCNLLYLKKGKAALRYLRYCPACAEEDRAAYGETYWRRMHQLAGVSVCPVHGCVLQDSSIPITSNASPALICAEESVPPAEEAVYSGNETEKRVASYVHQVFCAPVDMDTDIAIGRFLHSRLAYTKYLSPRGEQRNMALLYRDYTAYYAELQNNPIQEQWQLQKLFSSDRLSSYEICLVAMFLNVPVQMLTHMTLPEQPQHERFDDTIRILRAQGLKYPAIAKRLNASYDVVKAIGEGRY